MSSTLPISGRFSTVPTTAVFEVELRRADYRVLVLLCRFVNPKTGVIRVSQERLAEYLGVRRQFVSYTILRLERLGFLSRKREPSSSGFKRNVYIVHFRPMPAVDSEFATLMRLRTTQKRAGKSRGKNSPHGQHSPIASSATLASCSFNTGSIYEVVVEAVNPGDESNDPSSAKDLHDADKHSKR